MTLTFPITIGKPRRMTIERVIRRLRMKQEATRHWAESEDWESAWAERENIASALQIAINMEDPA